MYIHASVHLIVGKHNLKCDRQKRLKNDDFSEHCLFFLTSFVVEFVRLERPGAVSRGTTSKEDLES